MRGRRPLVHAGAGPTAVQGDPGVAKVLAAALEAAAGAAADEWTHGFHAYPARMHPRIARTVLRALSEPDALVLDPFAGSGTVLVECVVLGRRAIGVDLNPLALRIAEVRCAVRDERACERFTGTLGEIVEASFERVQGRVEVRAPLSRKEASWYEGHVLKELAGLREEIRAVKNESDRRALLVVLSSLVVKFSRQKADTAEEPVVKRIRKGLVTEFFARKGAELVERWEALAAVAPPRAPAPRLIEGDARRLGDLLGSEIRADLVVTSPPYGGTYDYAKQHARRFPWLGLDASALYEAELGARRNLGAGGPDARARWDGELRAALGSIGQVTRAGGRVVLLLGDAEVGGTIVEADRQVERIAQTVGFVPLAVATQPRPSWGQGPPRREHLMALGKTSRAR